jgi:hypothetical protein
VADKPVVGWRADILNDLPERRVRTTATTFDSAYDLISIAAHNRRMTIDEYIGRAALAMAVYDSGGDESWGAITHREPPMSDKRRHGLPKKRMFGRGFGRWEIEGLR